MPPAVEMLQEWFILQHRRRANGYSPPAKTRRMSDKFIFSCLPNLWQKLTNQNKLVSCETSEFCENDAGVTEWLHFSVFLRENGGLLVYRGPICFFEKSLLAIALF